MAWTVLFHEEFDVELQTLNQDLQDELLAHAKLLQEFGPQLGRQLWIHSRDPSIPT